MIHRSPVVEKFFSLENSVDAREKSCYPFTGWFINRDQRELYRMRRVGFMFESRGLAFARRVLFLSRVLILLVHRILRNFFFYEIRKLSKIFFYLVWDFIRFLRAKMTDLDKFSKKKNMGLASKRD